MFRHARALNEEPEGWWNRPWFLTLLVLAAAVPLAWPTTPALTDLMGHMGRYRIELSDPHSLLRTKYYGFEWAFVANLGVDLLIVPMAKLFGLELGVKLIAMTIPPLTAAGLLWIAREAHGRVPPTALLALPLVYNFTFIWGFLNFLLSMALALSAYALWLRLGRQGRWRLRHALFVPIGMALTVVHVFGWAVLGLLAFGAELVRARDRDDPVPLSIWKGGIACLSLAPPVLLLAIWRSGDAAGVNADFFFWRAKYVYLLSVLRNHSPTLDRLNVYLLWGLVAAGLVGIGVRMNRTLGIAAVMLILAFVALPRILLGSAYADMRLAPYMVIVAVVALAPISRSRRVAGAIAAAAVAIYAGRLAILTGDFIDKDRAYAGQLRALPHIAPGSRVFVEVSLQCIGRWETTRMDHLGAMAIVRRGAFVNGQWTAAGAQLLTIRYVPAKGYAEDPTQILRPPGCRDRKARSYPDVINTLPHDAFDYVWLIDRPRQALNSFPGLVPVWIGARSGILYRVLPTGSATSAIDTPTGSSPLTAR